MSTQSFECQIARGQISRYLGGDSFSPEALVQLEAHVSGCPDCKQHLGERKSALQSMLGQPQTPAETVHAPAPEVVASAIQTSSSSAVPAPAGIQALLGIVGLKIVPKPGHPAPAVAQVSSKAASPTQPAAWKPIAYSVALAMVLGAMSLASRNMDRLLGPKATTPMANKDADIDSKKVATKKTPLKQIEPLLDDQDDAAKAARAARNSLLARRAKSKPKGIVQHAAQPLRKKLQDDPYGAETAPRLALPGKPTTRKKVSAKAHATPRSGSKVAVLTKSGTVPRKRSSAPAKRVKLLQVEAHVQHRVRPHVLKRSKPHYRPKKRSATRNNAIHVYAP